MRKIWLLAMATYRRHIRSATFLILTFGLPLLVVVAGAISFIAQMGDELPVLGYVDQTGRLSQVTQVRVENASLSLTPYAGSGEAQTALQQGEIDAYLVIPGDYFQGGRPVFYGEEEPGARLEAALTRFMRQAMLSEAPGWILERLDEPSVLSYVAYDTDEEISEGPAMLLHVVTPAVMALAFALAVFTGANQMGSAIVREKDQRSMEMIITSLSPRELVMGKVLGMTLLTLTQVGIWTVGGGIVAGLALVASHAQNVSMPWSALVWGLLLGVPGYFLYAVVAAGMGVIAGDRQQARQLAGLLGFVGVSPLYLMGALLKALDGPLAVALTFFPLTAPMVALFRMALTQVPIWQLVVSLVTLIASLAASIWVVAHIFRTAMLMYGQSLRPAQIWRALREA